MKSSELVWQDAQHQDLLALVASLKESPETGVEILDQLTTYFAYHFSLEERYMRATNFPDAKAHIRAHRNFEDKINIMKHSPHIIEFGLRSDDFRLEICSFLNDWLVEHIFGLDKQLEQHILKSHIK
jgi:hemerythrin-like metal-binding protein